MQRITMTDEQHIERLLLLKIIPWVQSTGMSQVFCALPSWKELQRSNAKVPPGASVTHRPLKGKRVRLRGQRSHGQLSIEQDRWPEDQLLSARAPKLCFVVEGPVAFQLADYVFHCGPGHSILIPPGTPFPDGSLPVLDRSREHSHTCEILMILPRHGSLGCWTSRQTYDAQGHMSVTSCSYSILRSLVKPYLHQLIDEVAHRQLHWESISDDLLRTMVLLLHREIKDLPLLRGSSGPPQEFLDKSRPETHAITRAEEYIRVNLRLPLTIDRVARAVYLSRTTFVEQFRARTGRTFTQYVNDCRFEEACKLLKESDLAIKQISKQVGIQSRSLHLLVRDRTGISPTALRRAHRSDIKIDD